MDTVHVTCHSDRTELVFEGVLDAAHVREAYQTLDQCLQRGLALELHAAKLERVDTAGLQLLLAFCRAASEHGLKLEWRSVSDVLRANGTMVGVVDLLELPA
jgi:ABC-type transporter Mla MlaB component